MKNLSLVAALLCATFAFSQNNSLYNKISIEAAYGLNHPLSPSDNSGFDAGDFSEFKHVDIGGRYMINHIYGAKISYSYDRFQYKNTSALAITFNRISLEAVFNLAQVFNFSFNRQRSFQIQAHTGAGITFAQPKSIDKSEKIGNFIIGITPLFKVSDRIAITTDFSYIVNIKQHYDYGGIIIDPNYNSVTGSFINFTIGLNYAIGDGRDHADWF